MKNWIIFTACILVSVQELRPCRWVTADKEDYSLEGFLKRPPNGQCQYSTNIGYGQNKLASELIFFVKNLGMFSMKTEVFKCHFLPKGSRNECQNLMLKNLIFEPEERFKILAQVSTQTIIINVKNGNMDNKSSYKDFDASKIQIYGIQQFSPSPTLLFLYESLCQLAFPMLNMLFLFLFLKQPVLQVYTSLHLVTLTKMSTISAHALLKMDQKVMAAFTQFDNIAIIIGYSLNSIIIIFYFKILFQYVQFGAVSFRKTIENNFQESNSHTQLRVQRICSHMKKFIFRLTTFQYGKNQISKRLLGIGLALFLAILMDSGSPLMDLTVISIMWILLPAWLGLRDVSTSTELLNDYLHSKETEIKRDKVLFPKVRISIFFLVSIEEYLMGSGLIDNNKFRVIGSIVLIFVLWGTVMWILALLVRQKIGKGVKILLKNVKKEQNYCKKFENLWLYKILPLKFNFQENENSQPKSTECCICLQQISTQKCVETECGHIFHAPCLAQWSKSKMICPIDRNSLNQQMVRKMVSESVI